MEINMPIIIVQVCVIWMTSVVIDQ